MAKEKQPISTKARIFLSALALSGSLAAGCDRNQQLSPTETPRVSPSSTPTTEITNPTATIELSPTASPIPAPTEIVEPTPEKEVVYIPGITIDEDYLRNAFAGIGGGEVIENGQQETTALEFGQDYVSQSWGEKIGLASLSEDPIASLKYLISLGAYQGQEGVFSPGGQGEEAIFPQLADLSLFRITLNNVPSEEIQRTQDYREQTVPRNFKLYPGTQMTVVGLLETSSEDQPAFALVAFTDYLRASEENGVPRHYLALLPTHFSDDPENRNTLSLANRLEANGYGFDPETKTIIINNDEKKVVLEPNYIQGEDLVQSLTETCGIYFVDQIGQGLIKNPIVPFPEEVPEIWDVRRESDGTLVFQTQNQDGDFSDFAKAAYDQEKEAWSWEKIFSPEELLAKAPQIEGLRAVWQEGRIIYQAEAGNPYQLEEGAYAGEAVRYIMNQKVERGVGLTAPVLEFLLEDHQSLEALMEGRERFPLPFDPRGIEFEMEEVSFSFVPKGTDMERSVHYLGFNLPLGTVIYCPVLGDGLAGSERMISTYDYQLWTFPTLADEEELGDKCLSEGFCSVERVRTGEEIVERINAVEIRAEKPTTKDQSAYSLAVSPFFILFSQKSASISEQDRGWDNREEVFLGRPLFVIDSQEPAQKYTSPVDYQIFVRARQTTTNFDSLFTIDNNYVFILPSS